MEDTVGYRAVKLSPARDWQVEEYDETGLFIGFRFFETEVEAQGHAKWCVEQGLDAEVEFIGETS